MTKLPEFAMTYVVYWPKSQVMKVGRAYRSARIGSFVGTGAEIIVLVRDTPVEWERSALAAFRDRFPRAFNVASESMNLLSRGRGFTECFIVARSDVGNAVTVFKKAVAPHALHSRTKVQTGSVEPRRTVPVDAAPVAPVPVVAAVLCGSEGSGDSVSVNAGGDVLRVRSGCATSRHRRLVARSGASRLVGSVHVGQANLFANKPGGVARVCVDGWAGRVTLSGPGTRPGGGPECHLGATPGRLRGKYGRGEGGGWGIWGVPRLDVRPVIASSAGVPSSSEQHGSYQLWGVRGCSEDSCTADQWGDNSRGGCCCVVCRCVNRAVISLVINGAVA